MATTTKVQYLDLTGLQKYDALLKNYISDEDAKSYKVVRISGQNLQFFKSENPAADATPDTQITIPQQEVSNFIQKVTSATSGNLATFNADGTIGDSGSKPSDFLTTHQDISGKADKVTGGTENHFAALDDKGNIKDSGKSASDLGISLEVAQTATSGYAKTYIVKQGTGTNSEIGRIDIPKDMVVSSGTVETKSAAGDWGVAGTYIVLTIANATNDTLYIPASSLVDVYTAQQSAAQIQLTITGNVISAEIVDGSVDSDALASGAVVTAKIADGNVTKAKLEQDVQTSLGKADTALQSGDFEAITEAQINALFATA